MNERQQKFITNLKPIIEILKQKQRLKKHEKDLLDYATKYVDNIESLSETEVKILVLLYDGFKAEIKAEQKRLKAQEKEQIEKTKERKKRQRSAFLLGSGLLKEEDIIKSNKILEHIGRLVFLGLISDEDAIKYFGVSFSAGEIENEKYLFLENEESRKRIKVEIAEKIIIGIDNLTTKQKENMIKNFLDLVEKYS